MRRIVNVIIVAGILLSSTGCVVFERGKYAMRQTSRMLRPDTRDYDDDTDADSGEWDFVGDEGRADQKREMDPDRWWKKYIMSDKANSIERNLGVD